MSTTDILIKAADMLQPKGAWGRGASRAGLCAVDAIVEAGGSFKHVLLVRKYLGVEVLAAWNDAPGRTKAEVIAALRGAAKKAETL